MGVKCQMDLGVPMQMHTPLPGNVSCLFMAMPEPVRSTGQVWRSDGIWKSHFLVPRESSEVGGSVSL